MVRKEKREPVRKLKNSIFHSDRDGDAHAGQKSFVSDASINPGRQTSTGAVILVSHKYETTNSALR